MMNDFKKPNCRFLWRDWRGWMLILATLVGSYLAVMHFLVTPRVNPAPKKKVVVHGVFPYDRGWDLGKL